MPSGVKSPRFLNFSEAASSSCPSCSLFGTAMSRVSPTLPITSVKLSLSTLTGLRFSISSSFFLPVKLHITSILNGSSTSSWPEILLR